MYTWLVSKLLFPLHEKLKGHNTVSQKKHLDRMQWGSIEELHVAQTRNLQDLLGKITLFTPFYRSVRRELALSDEDMMATDILRRFPIVTKQVIRDNEDGFISTEARGIQFMRTSGSSGQPFKFGLGLDRIAHDVAAKWRATNWWNVDIGDREAVIWGSNIELGGQSLIKHCRDKLFRSKLFPAQHLDELGLDELFEKLQKFDPAMIYGYPSIMTLLAEHAKKHDKKYQGTSLKVIFCTAEKLYDYQRESIEDVFGAPVANGYGSRDAGFIAHECPQGGLHISAEDILVEVVDDNGQPCLPGETGRLLVTHTRTADFPMVRYDTGDLATLSSKLCGCGRNLPCFDDIIGRSNDVLYATNGSAIHGAYIGNIIREDDAVCHFQLVQENARKFTLSLVSYPRTSPNINELSDKLKAVLGENIDIESSVVESIPAEISGKYKYIINRYKK